jgi:hypothetical protein
LPQENVAVGLATKYYGETIFTSLLEFFADVAPSRKKLRGAIQNMLKVSSRDVGRAERMFYMYFSDVWFYDTSDTYMYLYSDLIVLFLLRFIQDDQHINFLKIKKDLFHDPHFMSVSDLSVIDALYRMYIDQTTELMAVPEKMNFKLLCLCDYPYVRRLKIQEDRKKNPDLDTNGHEYLSTLWMNIFSYVEKLTDTPTAVKDLLTKQEVEILQQVFEICAGKDVAQSYGYDHRKYIVDRMTALGFSGQP